MKKLVTISAFLLITLSTFAYPYNSYWEPSPLIFTLPLLFWILVWIVIPMAFVGPLADKRKVGSCPWMVACVFIGWLSPLILALAYTTTRKEAQRHYEIKKAYDEIVETESKNQLS